MVLRWFGLGVGAALFLSSAGPAKAVPQHWDAMVELYGWSGDCRLCHENSVGSASTATQPFAQTLRTLGLSAATSRGDLVGIMYVAQVLGTDSDGDLISDVVEIAYRGDPNDPELGIGELHPDDNDDDDDERDGSPGSDDPPEDATPTSCAASKGAPHGSSGPSATLLAAAALVLRRSWRHATRSTSATTSPNCQAHLRASLPPGQLRKARADDTTVGS